MFNEYSGVIKIVFYFTIISDSQVKLALSTKMKVTFNDISKRQTQKLTWCSVNEGFSVLEIVNNYYYWSNSSVKPDMYTHLIKM